MTEELSKYSEPELEALKDWFLSLTIAQMFFIKGCYESMQLEQAKEYDQEFVH